MAVWHADPVLKGHFHPQYPDDIQVVVHDGSFRFTQTQPELIWVRILSATELDVRGKHKLQVYRAKLLNQPHELKMVKLGDDIQFVAHAGYQYPIYTTQQYLVDRAKFEIIPCTQCGLPELFDPVYKLFKVSFPQLPEPFTESGTTVAFSSKCPACGTGMLMVNELPEVKPQESEKRQPWQTIIRRLRR